MPPSKKMEPCITAVPSHFKTNISAWAAIRLKMMPRALTHRQTPFFTTPLIHLTPISRSLTKIETTSKTLRCSLFPNGLRSSISATTAFTSKLRSICGKTIFTIIFPLTTTIRLTLTTYFTILPIRSYAAAGICSSAITACRSIFYRDMGLKTTASQDGIFYL